jgi:hypothetical protein
VASLPHPLNLGCLSSIDARISEFRHGDKEATTLKQQDLLRVNSGVETSAGALSESLDSSALGLHCTSVSNVYPAG